MHAARLCLYAARLRSAAVLSALCLTGAFAPSLGWSAPVHPMPARMKKTPTGQALAAKPETVGGGTVTAPAAGPAPSFGLGGPGMVLVKNWRFGTSGTIKNMDDMNANFLYHDQHNSIANGGNAYGALIVAPDDAHAIFPGDVYYYNDNGTPRGDGLGQPIEGRDSAPVRQFTADSLKTFLVPLKHATTMVNGVLTVLPDRHEVGCGSFMASWFAPAGGSLLGQDLVWETKVRYKTPPYFWFSLWTDGNRWRWDNGARGAEHDLIETYGEDYASEGAGTAHGKDNFDGHLWHSNSVAGSDTVDYFIGAWWGAAMDSVGVKSYDATQYHIWTWVYKKDNSYAMYVDGIKVQSGTNYYWTYGNRVTDTPINMSFRFDGAWGHRAVRQVDKPLAASALAGAYYEYAYSRVYLSRPMLGKSAAVAVPGTMRAVNYESGGEGTAYHQTFAGGQTLYRPDNSGADGGTTLGWTAPGQWYKYKVYTAKPGLCNFSFQVGSPDGGGKFHVEDEHGTDLTGPVTVPKTGDFAAFALTVATHPAMLSAGPHTLKWVQDTGGYDLYSMTVSALGGPFHGPHTVPGTVQVEDYDTGGAGFAYSYAQCPGSFSSYRPADLVGIEPAGDAGGGLDVGWTALGNFLRYTVSVPTAGTYKVVIRAASGDAGGSLHLQDAQGKNLSGPIKIPGTGGWQKYMDCPAKVTLPAGTQTLTLFEDTGGYNLNSMTFASP